MKLFLKGNMIYLKMALFYGFKDMENGKYFLWERTSWF